jgi:PAS domain S-box-containing protein
MTQPATEDLLRTALGRADAAEAKYRSLVELIPAITYAEEVDSGKTFAVSPQIETILGYTQEQWMGDADIWIDCIVPEDRDRVVAACEFANQVGEPFLEEYRIVAGDGRIVSLRDEAELVYDSNGKPLCWQGVMSVITPPDQFGMS